MQFDFPVLKRRLHWFMSNITLNELRRPLLGIFRVLHLTGLIEFEYIRKDGVHLF